MSSSGRDYRELVRRSRGATWNSATRIEQTGQFQSEGSVYPLRVALIGESEAEKPSVMIDAGMHGDEPAGGEAAMRFIETAPGDTELPWRFRFTVFPCNNPTQLLQARAAKPLGLFADAFGIDTRGKLHSRARSAQVIAGQQNPRRAAALDTQEDGSVA